MIAAWILYALVVGLLVGGGALMVETLLRAHRLPTRWVWAGAMALSVFWPFGHFVWKNLPQAAPVGPAPEPLRVMALEPLAVQVAPESFLRMLDGPIVLGWILASGALILLLGLLVLKTIRLKKDWTGVEAGGRSVLLSPDWGPAVIGFVRPQIVLPEWCRELDDETLNLILDHEAEHLKAGDLRLTLSAGLLPILLPWSLPLWWQLARLRVAVEGDCDLRVLRRHPHRTRPYLELLLEVGGRLPRGRALAAMLSESEETLERRIRIMTMPFPKKPWARGVLLAGIGGILVALACWAPGPTDIQDDALTLPPAIEIPPPPSEIVTLGDLGTPGADAEGYIAPTRSPEIRNLNEVLAALAESYPAALKEAGIGGETDVWFYVDETGRVMRSLVNKTSGHPELDEAAMRVADILSFTPAMLDDEPVSAWTAVPVRFGTAATIAASVSSDSPEIPIPPTPEELASGEAEPWERPDGQEVAAAPTFTPFTVRPDITNREEVGRALQSEYPPLLKDAGIGGSVQVWFFIDEEGQVLRTLVNESSGHQALDEAALRVAAVIEFSPALNRDKQVPVWISLPITFRAVSEGGAQVRNPRTLEDNPVDELPPPPSARATSQDISAAPTFTPFTVRPDISNRNDVARALEREYPPLLRDAGIGGSIQVWFFIDDRGIVQRTLINETSGHEALDEAAMRVAEIIEFTPAMNRDREVPVWISLPITFQVREVPAVTASVEPVALEFQTDLQPRPTPTAAEIRAAPTFTPYTVRPNITNRDQVAKSLTREYPRLLRDAGVGGKVQVWFFIDENGRVQRTLLNETSGRPALDEAAMRVADVIAFSPALNRDKAVPVWISLPVTFQMR